MLSKECEMGIEKAKLDLVKREMDDKIMLSEAIEAARNCYQHRNISEIRMTSYGENDQGGDSIKQMVDAYGKAKRESGNK